MLSVAKNCARPESAPLSLWTQQAKKTIENNVALDKLIHYKIRLDFLKTANSSLLGFPGNQLTEDIVVEIVPHFYCQNGWKIACA